MPTATQGGCMHADIKGEDAFGLPSWNNFTVRLDTPWLCTV